MHGQQNIKFFTLPLHVFIWRITLPPLSVLRAAKHLSIQECFHPGSGGRCKEFTVQQFLQAESTQITVEFPGSY